MKEFLKILEILVTVEQPISVEHYKAGNCRGLDACYNAKKRKMRKKNTEKKEITNEISGVLSIHFSEDDHFCVAREPWLTYLQAR